MSETYDVIVIGLGGMGSAAIYELSKRGANVLGIEQFGVAHARGSSHGETRIIRRAYFEHPDYVPLLDHTYRQWRELEQESGNNLMDLCGLVLSGPADGEAVPGVLLAKEKHGVQIEQLNHAEAAQRFPQFTFPKHHTILVEDDAGYLRVDDCVRTHCEQAKQHGATLQTDEAVINWSANAAGVTVTTDAATYSAAKLVIACGAWSSKILSALDLNLRVLRKSVFWFSETNPATNSWPVFYIENGERSFYGLPGLDGQSVKVAEHSGGNIVTNPGTVPRDVIPDELAAVQKFVNQSVHNVETSAVTHNVCMYSMSADGHFIVDPHPQHENVVIAAGFSGHGFKFTPVIGTALADITLTGRTDLPVDFLKIR